MKTANVSLTISQEADGCAENATWNFLTVKAEGNAGEPDDWYFVIESPRWAVGSDDIERFLDDMRELLVRVAYSAQLLGKPGFYD